MSTKMLSAISYIWALIGDEYSKVEQGSVYWYWEARPGEYTITLRQEPESLEFTAILNNNGVMGDLHLLSKVYSVIGWAACHGIGWKML